MNIWKIGPVVVMTQAVFVLQRAAERPAANANTPLRNNYPAQPTTTDMSVLKDFGQQIHILTKNDVKTRRANNNCEPHGTIFRYSFLFIWQNNKKGSIWKF